MQRISLATTLLALAFAALLSGCASSTERQLLQDQIALHRRAVDASKQTLSQLQGSQGPGSYQVKFYISNGALNGALTALDNLTIPIPEIDATANILSVRVADYGAFPTVTLRASATRDNLSVEVEATAVLLPSEQAFNEFRISLLAFTPKVSWYSFEVTKAKFIRDLLSLEVVKLTNRLPAITVPVDKQLAVGSAASTNSVRFQATDHPSFITMNVTSPTTQYSVRPANVRYYFLDGIYIFGDLK